MPETRTLKSKFLMITTFNFCWRDPTAILGTAPKRSPRGTVYVVKIVGYLCIVHIVVDAFSTCLNISMLVRSLSTLTK